jgi:transcriptional regulator with GAF, ATPase, and Fis domain
MKAKSGGTTLPNAPSSAPSPPPLALHFVYPAELVGLVIDVSRPQELGREGAGDGRGGSEPPAPARLGAFVAIPHATVSRHHASIGESIGGSVPTLIDRGARNGTRVNGQAVQGSVPLLQHAVVRFGDAIAIVDERTPVTASAEIPPGSSPRIARLREVVQQVAPDRASILIIGETGTGKELLASEIHRQSGRSGPLLKLNCAELSPQLVESQLFGHERGSFTGAVASHTGLFGAAQGGTLFLDEVAEIPLELQAKLLRVLQEGEIRPVGSVRTQQVDVRIVCATNAELAERVREGRFRRDLHARLAFFELRLPPLRERKQDILWWVELFRRRWSESRGRHASLLLRPHVAEHVLLHPWQDNLRGLDRLVHRVLSVTPEADVGMSMLREVMPELFPDALVELAPEAPFALKTRAPSDRPSREQFLAVYESTGCSVRATSKHFGRDRRQVYRWLEQFGIDRKPADDES